jgi:hypothetical protein
VNFLLECIGFPPDAEEEEIVQQVIGKGESVPWRGPEGEHYRLSIAQGLELRLDREEGTEHWTIFPWYREDARLRVALRNLIHIPDSPFDILLVGWADPPIRALGEEVSREGAYLFSTYLTDARRLPQRLPEGHVLAVSVSGFALDVSYLGPNDGVRDPLILDKESGAWIQPLGGSGSPGGCNELSVRIQEVRHIRNPLTGRDVDILRVDAPSRSLHLFVSPWDLERANLQRPRPGDRIEGVFFFNGRIAGGLPTRQRPANRPFG